MLMKVRGEGQLRHHFWSEYHATIAIIFNAPEHASKLVKKFPGFVLVERQPGAIRFHGKGSAVELAKHAIQQHRVPMNQRRDHEQIDSLVRSADLGPPFAVEVDV
jgi:hypothetical protein